MKTSPRFILIFGISWLLSGGAWAEGVEDSFLTDTVTVNPVIVNPAVPHPEHAGGSVSGEFGVSLRLCDIPVAPSDKFSGKSDTHIQGEDLEYGIPVYGFSESRTIQPPGKGASDEDDVPTPIEAFPGSKAAGDKIIEFDGISETGSKPPDTVIAAGPAHLLEATNRHFVVFSKLGNVKRELTSFSTFFDNVKPSGWSGKFFDPRVLFSQPHQKYVMLILGKDDTNETAHAFIAISQTDDPTGSWWVWRKDASSLGNSDAWWDYASLGADTWGLYITGNFFYWPSSPSSGLKTAVIWSLNPDMFNGGSSNGSYKSNLTWPDTGDDARDLQVALPHSTAGGGETFLVNTIFTGGSKVALWTLTGDRTNNPTLSRAVINMKSYNPIQGTVDQPGSLTDLDGGKTKTQNAVYANRRVYFTVASDTNNDGSAASVIVTKLNVDSNTKEWDDRLSTTDNYYFYPALALRGGGTSPNIMVYMNWSSSTQYVSAVYKEYVNHPIDNSGTFSLYHASTTEYVDIQASTGRNRWGDYSGATYDWTCGHFFGAVEYATAVDEWGTRIAGNLSGSESTCSLLDVTSPNPSGIVLTAGDSHLITWEHLGLPVGDTISINHKYDAVSALVVSGLPRAETSYLWSVPNVPTTSGRIAVTSSDGASTTVSDESDESFTILGLPDLVSQSLSAPATASSGQTITVSNAVLNSGPVSSPSFSTEIRLSTNNICSTSDTLLATWTNGTLAAGSTVSDQTSVTIPAGWTDATAYLCQMIDRTDAVSEFDDGNNNTSVPIAITAGGDIFADGFESGGFSAWSSTSP